MPTATVDGHSAAGSSWADGGDRLRSAPVGPHHRPMLRRLAIVAMLTVSTLAAGCGYHVANCNRPAEPFALDEELTAREVDRLIEENHVIDRNNLVCDVVCESIYLDQHPEGAATNVENCTLKLDGEFSGDPEEVVGSLLCDGRGIPQFCSDG